MYPKLPSMAEKRRLTPSQLSPRGDPEHGLWRGILRAHNQLLNFHNRCLVSSLKQESPFVCKTWLKSSTFLDGIVNQWTTFGWVSPTYVALPLSPSHLRLIHTVCWLSMIMLVFNYLHSAIITQLTSRLVLCPRSPSYIQGRQELLTSLNGSIYDSSCYLTNCLAPLLIPKPSSFFVNLRM